MLDTYPENLVSIEWHNSSFTPGNSDFDIPEYSTRGALYGVGGIPHTQWNGVEETVGGYGNGNWEPFVSIFTALYNSMVGDETPYEISINGYAGSEVSYDVIVTMDSDMSNSNQKVDVFVVEDNIWSYWTGASQYHNARNVARDWLLSEDLTISSSGESETFSGTFELGDSWDADSVKIIAIVQNYSSKQIYQVHQVNINEMNPDIDDDGVLNGDDNCIDIFNPGQEDTDLDLIGDVCDPCDNLVYIMGNLNGDIINGQPGIDILDVLELVDYLIDGDSYECQDDIMNINGDGFINVVDVISLIQMILNGEG
jgi:hypothetical protein|tara:strand:+ start:847 stop:1782 length:936 start_codon:yes stop_codon:yes gene_type:complete